MMRLLLLLPLVLYAALAWSVGLDRMTAGSPELARLVPEAMYAKAHEALARSAVIEGDIAAGREHAIAAIEANPTGPDPAALLGVFYLADDKPDLAEEAFRVAALFGWRNVATQQYWYAYALAVGEFDVAADRADAIMRTSPGFSDMDTLLLPLEESEQGRAALAARLADESNWAGSYFVVSDDLSAEVLHNRAQVAGQLAEIEGPDCAARRPFLRDLMSRGLISEVSYVFGLQCPSAPPPTQFVDGDFSAFASEGSDPLGWVASRSGDLLVQGGRGREMDSGVTLSNDASATRRVLFQHVALPPGQYLLSAKSSEPGSALDRLSATLRCGQGRPSGETGNLAGSGVLLETPDCPSQILSLWLRPGDGTVSIDELELTPVD